MAIFSKIVEERKAGLLIPVKNFAPGVISVSKVEIITISCEHRVLTSVSTVEHFDTLSIPIFLKKKVTINLHLVSFTIIMTLIHCSSVVDIFRVLMPYFLY